MTYVDLRLCYVANQILSLMGKYWNLYVSFSKRYMDLIRLNMLQDSDFNYHSFTPVLFTHEILNYYRLYSYKLATLAFEVCESCLTESFTDGRKSNIIRSCRWGLSRCIMYQISICLHNNKFTTYLKKNWTYLLLFFLKLF